MSYNSNINYGQQVPMAQTVPVQGSPMPQVPQTTYPQQPQAPGYFPQQPSYGVDQTQFSTPRPVATPAPAVEVGFFDKVKSYFNDVYRSDENLRAYKSFQQQVDTDPMTLKPGSHSSERVTDLQQKLNIAGVKANVNGVYGYATGEAVKDFKRLMNINDGFLDGDGKPAVTDIATSQMQSVLNSVVSKQLNPQMPGTGNNMPITQEELLWAQNLATRIQNFGYQPNAQERSRYNDILARQQAQNNPGVQPAPNSPAVPSVPTPGQPPYPQQPTQTAPPAPTQQTQPAPVSQQEMDWALQMQERIVNGYRPTAQEAASYDSIQKRYAAQQATQPQPQQQPLPTGPVSQAELDWVRSKAGQQLSSSDMSKYQNIMDRYMAQQGGAPQPSGQLRPVTQEELDWAVQLQEKIGQGYQPTPDEAARYTDIFNRYQDQAPDPVQAQPTHKPEPQAPAYNPGTTAPMIVDNSVSPQELQWAVDLQNRIDTQGYRPTQQDIVRYTDIYNRYQKQQEEAAAQPAPQPQAPAQPTQPTQPTAPAQPTAPVQPAQPQQPVAPQGATQDEMEWARRLEGRVVRGEQVPQAEIDRYNDIQLKLANFGVAPAASSSAPTAVNGPALTSGSGPVSQSEVDWAMNLQHRVQFENYQPSGQEVAQYTDIFNRYQAQLNAQQPAAPAPQPQAPVQPTAPAAAPSSGAVSPEEIQWAQQLQQMVQQGYQASQQEVARYTDIYNRLQNQGGAQAPAAQQPTAPQPTYSAPTQPAAPTPAPGSTMINVNAADPELQWALELLNRYRQGYQPSQNELAMYERIIASKAVPGATP